MGANNSYEKNSISDAESQISSLFDELQNYLNESASTNPVATIQGILPVLTLDNLDDEQLRLLKKSKGNDSIIKLKTSLDLFALYNNYSRKNSVIIKDLSKKYKNQNKELKKQSENNDMIQHNIRIVKNKIEKIKYANKVLLIFIIVFIVIIAILALFVYIKIVN